MTTPRQSVVAIGIDGGGTSTRAAIVDGDGVLLGHGESGPSNYQAVGIDRCRESILEAISGAWENAALPRHPASALFLGMAGVVSDTDRDLIRKIAADIEPDAIVEIDHDLRPALAAGVGSGEGMVLVAGTGSACYGRTADGMSWRSGGWGHLLDDSGGGYRIGLDGIIAVVREADGRGKSTILSTTLLPSLGIAAIDEILHTVHQQLTRADIAALAPLVLQAAEEGDDVATGIIRQGARELALMVGAVDTALVWQQRPVALVCSGSLFRNGYYRELVEGLLEGVSLVDPLMSAAHAAGLLGVGLLQRGKRFYHKGTKDTKEHRVDRFYMGGESRISPRPSLEYKRGSGVEAPRLNIDRVKGLLTGAPVAERRLSDLRGIFADEHAYEKALGAGDPVIYTVSSIEPGDGEGDMHYGIGRLMPGRIGDEYFMTKGHLHEWRPAAEVYIGLEGEGMMLLEDEASGESRLLPLVRDGIVYVPGHTAHRTINTGTEPLVYIGIFPARAGHDYASIAERNFRKVVVDRKGKWEMIDRSALRQ